MERCPCYSDKDYTTCCGRFIDGREAAATPEELMRSRYTAYSMSNFDYIKETMKSPADKDFDPDQERQANEQIKWVKLEVLQSGMGENAGYVEFNAHYTQNGILHIMHELSEFKRINNKWYYTNRIETPTQIKRATQGRNDTCLCGSGKKYKKCCAL